MRIFLLKGDLDLVFILMGVFLYINFSCGFIWFLMFSCRFLMGYFGGGGGGGGLGVCGIIGGGIWLWKDIGNWNGFLGSGKCINWLGLCVLLLVCIVCCLVLRRVCFVWVVCWVLDLWFLGVGFSLGNWMGLVGLIDFDSKFELWFDIFFCVWSCLCFWSLVLKCRWVGMCVLMWYFLVILFLIS